MTGPYWNERSGWVTWTMSGCVMREPRKGKTNTTTQDALNDITDAEPDFENDVAYPFVPTNRRRVDAYRRAIVLEEMAIEDQRQRRQRAGLTDSHDTMTEHPAPPTTTTMASSSSSSTTTSRRKRAGTASAGAKPGKTKKATTTQEKGNVTTSVH